MTNTAMGIEISKDGPYLVTGPIPLDEQIITPAGHHNELVEGKKLPQSEDYHLCRCGHSKNAPFCDGTHLSIHFKGTEVADRRPYAERVQEKDMVQGTTMTLLDDERCAFARFCHQDHGDVWNLTANDADPTNRAEALHGVHECIAGRLVEVDKQGQIIEDQQAPRISVIQDPEKDVSGPLYVRGPIPVTSADGQPYEVRNRQALCRCGASENKPFCDASHVSVHFQDSGYPDSK